MIKRELYLKKIRGFYDTTDLIKIIFGLRRCGKSVLLTQIIEELKEKKVPDDHIININFEEMENYKYVNDVKALHEYIMSLKKDDKIYYVFLDEIHIVKDFDIMINSLRVKNNFSIFITGSNSRLTVMELSTVLTGRYVSFKINPLNYKEFVQLTNLDPYSNETLNTYFKYGGLPKVYSMPNDSDKINYIEDTYNAIILKDITSRLNLNDVNLFNLILQYIIETSGREFSFQNIVNYLKHENREIYSETLYSYLEALEKSFIINKVNRFDVHGKSVLKTLCKYYLSDFGLKYIKDRNKKILEYIMLEILVYNELVAKGYEVYVGKTKKGEVDFVAINFDEIKYVQVCTLLEDNEDIINREFGAYDEIKDNNLKYVISKDEFDKSKDGIKHLNIYKFLMSDDF